MCQVVLVLVVLVVLVVVVVVVTVVVVVVVVLVVVVVVVVVYDRGPPLTAYIEATVARIGFWGYALVCLRILGNAIVHMGVCNNRGLEYTK